ncbi:vitamin K epoxide reductase family protein [Microbacterium ulmi]|uniref:Vitamin K epoxide reductase n=1 Tax=Microbacterium ulmi TaxID=179095 RepID=A0A7Y2LXX8_9MICO|nr:vitamin K epoxide reductase family protein [Microbacterium ulmi]NII70765.1 putative membrane protein [Microbacterium ulmi]NNH02782.1 Vitamin K epoxide reductase [Microbacterium ulmi]
MATTELSLTGVRPPRGLAIFWIVAGAAGGIVSFLLYLEYVGQLQGTEPLISCSWGVVVTCGPNLLSPGGNLLGFTNSLIGLVLFGGPVHAGVSALAAPAGLRTWYWRVYGVFVLGGFLLVHVFAWRSVFEYGSLCPWCMIVWLVTIPLFWFTLGWELRDGVWGDRPRRVGAVVFSWAVLLTILDYAAIAIAAQVRLDVLGTL